MGLTNLPALAGRNGCGYLTDSRQRAHPAGVYFRLLPCGRRSTRNRRSSLLRFEADENISPSGAECAIYANSYCNDIYFKFGRKYSSECPFSVPPLCTPTPCYSRRLLPTLRGTKRAAVNFSILRSNAKQKRTLGSERPEGVPVARPQRNSGRAMPDARTLVRVQQGEPNAKHSHNVGALRLSLWG